MRLIPRIRATGIGLLMCAMPAVAADSSYEDHLVRLAEILGSIHFLHGLCHESEGPWRAQMEVLLRAESPSEERRAEMIGSFNHGYRAFAATYTRCTESAEQAIEYYKKEGETLTNDIVMQFGE
ncbi:TIGR02301 family protein [Chelativorans sp. YIM 93263]|uniref:TIGR02301 family protein n=1 Tax=Chelativorans sp. YIM 93263 TaxID=2906648 RepID=UPI002378E099|nr:TIGR02301 family protein [Chelativorans sp. YIM 93263]